MRRPSELFLNDIRQRMAKIGDAAAFSELLQEWVQNRSTGSDQRPEMIAMGNLIINAFHDMQFLLTFTDKGQDLPLQLVTFEDSEFGSLRDKINHWLTLHPNMKLSPIIQAKPDGGYFCVIAHRGPVTDEFSDYIQQLTQDMSLNFEILTSVLDGEDRIIAYIRKDLAADDLGEIRAYTQDKEGGF